VLLLPPLLPSPPEPLLQLGGAGRSLHPALHLHVVMGAGIAAEVEDATKGAAFRVEGSIHHTPHPGLYQGSGTHGARLERHHQGAVVEAPVAAQPGCLLQRHQFGMAQRLLIAFASVDAPTDRPSIAIQNHRRHWDFPFGTDAGGAPQQAFHPEGNRIWPERCHGAVGCSQQPAILAVAATPPSRWRMDRP